MGALVFHLLWAFSYAPDLGADRPAELCGFLAGRSGRERVPLFRPDGYSGGAVRMRHGRLFPAFEKQLLVAVDLSFRRRLPAV